MIETRHFLWRTEGPVGVITLNRPERKNPLTFESYDELRNHFWALQKSPDVKAIVITGAGGRLGVVFEELKRRICDIGVEPAGDTKTRIAGIDSGHPCLSVVEIENFQ